MPDPLDPTTAALGIAALGSAATAGWLGFRLRTVRLWARSLEDQLALKEKQYLDAATEAESAEARNRSLQQEVARAATELARIQEEVDEARDRVADAERKLGRAGDMQGRVDDEARARAEAEVDRRNLATRARDLKVQVDRLHRVVADRDRALARHEQALSALGVDLAPDAHDPLDPGRRSQSRAVLRDLRASTGARAAALVDRTGLALFAAGKDAGIIAVGDLSAGVEALADAAGTLLPTPLHAATLVTGRTHTTTLRVGWDGTWLGVHGTPDAPMGRLRRAALALVGTPGLQGETIASPALLPPVEGETDDALGAVIAGWAERWSIQHAALYDPDGLLLATSDEAGDRLPAMTLVRDAATSVLHRASSRTGTPTPLELHLHGARDGFALVRPVQDDPEGPLLVIAGETVPPPHAVDALASTLAWHTRRVRPLSATA